MKYRILKNTQGAGTKGAGVTRAQEFGDGIVHKTILTVEAALAIADGAANAHAHLYTFPAGAIEILGAVMDAAVANTDQFNASDADHFYLGVGSADGSGALTTSEQNVVASTDFDTVGGTDLAHDWHAQSSAVAVIDGTSAAVDLRLNGYIPTANDKGANTLTITGTLTIHWINLGDY